MAKVRRLAITIKGGVSLGAYEAGALHQSLALIARNNATDGSTKWYVDVITGASAGSMTAASTAVALIAGPDVNPPNPFYSAWVQDVSVSALMPAGNSNIRDNLFDATRLDQIAARNVRLPFNALHPHPAFNPATVLKLAFTLSRLQTQPTTVPTWAGKLAYKEYADLARFDLSVDRPAKSAVTVKAYGVAACSDAPQPQGPLNVVGDFNAAWRALVQAAIASGSFPIAFEPRCLRRWKNNGWVNFYFVDGGLYDNDPVGEAINVAHETDWSDEDAQDRDRRFLIVHTEPSDLSPPTAYPLDGALQNIAALEALGKIAGGFIKESQTFGLRGIGPVNDAIAKRFGLLNDLALTVIGGAALPSLTTAVNAMAAARNITPNKLADFRRWLVDDLVLAKDVELEADPQRMARQLADNVQSLNGTQRQAFTDLALFYDLSANLIDKVPVKPILIAPPRDDLAGDPLYGFGGFFDQALRDRDYKQGEFDAYNAWHQISQVPGEFDLSGAVPPPAPPPGDSLKPEQLKTYKSELAKFRERVKVVLDSLSSELVGGHGVLSWVETEALKAILGTIGDWAIGKGTAPNS